MLIKVKTGREIPSSEITPQGVYQSRRDFMKTAAQVSIGAGLIGGADFAQAVTAADLNLASKPAWLEQQIAARKPVPADGPFNTSEQKTPFDDVSTYNNFYEFGTDKRDPSSNAKDFKVEP